MDLLEAVKSGREDTVKLLLDNGANPNVEVDGFGTILHAAAFAGDITIVQLLLERGANSNAQGGEYGTTLQAAAASWRDASLVQLFLDIGADINAQGGRFGTALQAAAFGGDLPTVQLLLEKGAEINAQGGEYGNALQAAAASANTWLVRLLLERGAEINAQGGKFGTALQAAATGDPSTVRLLLEKGADVNAEGGEYGTALQAAVTESNKLIVRLLLEKGANVNAKGGEHGTALQAAVSVRDISIVRLLIRRGADMGAQGGKYGSALQAAIFVGDIPTVRLLIDKNADVNAEGTEYGNALQAAASRRDIPTVQLHLAKRRNKIPITQEILKEVFRSWNAVQLLKLFLDEIEDKLFITQEILVTAAQSENAYHLMALLLESSVEISDDYIWVRGLTEVGYSYQEIVDVLLGGSVNPPCIPFEPTNFPLLEVQPDRHITGCCHSVLLSESCPIPNSNIVTERDPITLDHKEVIYWIEEACGLAGIKPSTPGETDWAGCIKFSDNASIISVSYALPTEKNNLIDIGTFWPRISRVLEGLYHAAALLQANDLCCNSFTVLKSGFKGHESSSLPLGEVVSVSFQLVLNLLKELQDVMNPASAYSGLERLLSASKATLGLIWPGIPEVSGDSSFQWCLHLCALAVQFLCLGFRSHCQAHIGSVQPFFFDFSAPKVRLTGLQTEEDFPFLVAELVNLTCLGNMTRGQVLLFRASEVSPDKQTLETQIQLPGQNHDILGRAEDILDTWGPGNLIFRESGSGAPVAIKIGDGFVFARESGKCHWSQTLPDIKALTSIDIELPLLIGSVVAINSACKHIEVESRLTAANLLEELGTTRSSWKKSQRQLAIQGGQYVVGQATETWNKQTGISVKDQGLAYPPQILIQYMDSYWGVQVSYCTGVSKRVRLRKLVADFLPHFTPRSPFDSSDLQAKLKDETLRPKDLQVWLSGLSPDLRLEILTIICDILDTLRHTGLDSTDTYICVAWPFEGNVTQCFKIPLEQDSSWARFLADSHDCATFAYITMECFETTEFRCSNIPKPCLDIRLLETSVSRSRKENVFTESCLQHEEVCYFSKQDTMFWVKVLKKHADQPASLVDLMAIQSLPHSIRQRLHLTERRKQRSRLRECATIWTRGEVVSVSSARRSSKLN